jgi:ATP synthase protein I
MNPGNLYRQLARYYDIIFILPAAMAVGIGIGYLLDMWLGSSPWLLILFGGLGTVAGFYQVLKIVTRKEE